jgi:hypothetical protein
MRQALGKPVGLWLVAGVIALEGLGLLVAAVQLVLDDPDEWLTGMISAAIGGLLVLKAYKLWSLHRAAWLMIVVATTLGGLVHTLEIARGHGEPSTWFAAAWALATVTYLTRPAVRQLFVRSR